MDTPESLTPDEAGQLAALRRELHTFPELSGRESGTAARLSALLAGCRPARIIDHLGGTGLAAVFDAPDLASGPTVALRAELDALPIQETGTLPHASRHPGAAHACGHDGHMAMLCGVALALRREALRRGRLVLLFQPAEETGQGAGAVRGDPRWQDLAIERIFALHNLPGYPLGALLLRPGPFAAGSAGLVVRLHGRTAHAAYPEQGRSPVPALGRLVTMLVGLPIQFEREAPQSLALVTVVHARLGEIAFGTSPADAEIMATLRSDDQAVLSAMQRRAEELVRGEAARDGLGCEVSWVEEFPLTVNDPLSVRVARRAARRAGLAIGRPQESPFRWSEDFGRLLQATPGAMIGIGAGEDQPALHASDHDFPDSLLPLGVRFYCSLMAELGMR